MKSAWPECDGSVASAEQLKSLKDASWLCFQLGSREHYAIPRALHQQGRLAGLITDTWIPRPLALILGKIHPGFAQRRHDEIPDILVSSATLGRLAHDIFLRLNKKSGWEAIMTRNQWFQEWAARRVPEGSEARTLFSYSYTARLPFREAKRRGLQCVLGQIDPGPLEAEVVNEQTGNYASLDEGQSDPPPRYWEQWREEVDLADRIIVNSQWSAELLQDAGVPRDKMVEIPLAYEAARRQEKAPERCGPELESQDTTRSLRALFLGQVILRKGIGQLFDAMRRLLNEPVTFVIAGPLGVPVPEDLRNNSKVRFTGPVDRAAAGSLFRDADVFLLPTLSDGFALTQLEAQAHGLPVIVSRHCGTVIEDGVNGILLDKITPEAIAAALLRLLANPEELAAMRSRSFVRQNFSLAALAERLAKL